MVKILLKKLARNRLINKILVALISLWYSCYDFDMVKKLQARGVRHVHANVKKRKIVKLIKNKYHNSFCFFPACGLGDVFFVASLIKEFKKRNNGKVVYFTCKKSVADFLKNFPSIDEVVFDEDLDFLYNEQTLQNKIKRGKLIRVVPHLMNLLNVNWCKLYNNFFNLPQDVERELPLITEQNLEIAKKEFKRLKLIPQKTILIIPDAVMFDYRTIDMDFYKLLTNRLKEKGYDVVFNTKLKEYKKFKNTFLDIMDFIAFAKQVKHIVSVRSGITDLFVGMGINNLTALYPQNLEIIWAPDKLLFDNLHKNYIKTSDTEFENIFNLYSLNKIFKRTDINEIVYNYDDEEITDKIIEKIDTQK